MTRQLSYQAYQQTFQAPMQDITATADEVVAIWPYVEAIPVGELSGFIVGDVAHVYRHPDSLFEHVLIATNAKNVFLAVIIDFAAVKIVGHYLLILSDLYGLSK